MKDQASECWLMNGRKIGVAGEILTLLRLDPSMYPVMRTSLTGFEDTPPNAQDRTVAVRAALENIISNRSVQERGSIGSGEGDAETGG